jgi:beta-RFAP synthase
MDEERSHWPNYQGENTIPTRRFGGVGLMVEQPGVTLQATPSSEWEVAGSLAERALFFARRFAKSVGRAARMPMKLTVGPGAREHAGLGTGTQLGLAVAHALALAWKLKTKDICELAYLVGRGDRSALGIHGFAQGGLVVDGGKGRTGSTAPLIARVDFPRDWRILLVLPEGGEGLHGAAESLAFERLQVNESPLARTEVLCRLVLLGLLPALVEEDVQAFGEALHDFNARVGAGFSPVQGGIYAHARTAELVAYFHRQRVPGAGQSSWGPTVLAIFGDPDRAEYLARRVRKKFALRAGEVIVTRACNGGARIEMDHPSG